MTLAVENILLRTVIEGGYCIGCGACAAIDKPPFEMQLDEFGQYQAVVKNDSAADDDAQANEVCPFSDKAMSEDLLASERFSGHCPAYPHVGYVSSIHAGYVSEGTFRSAGSSGGFGAWICHELLRTGMVDYVVNVRETPNTRVLFAYSISENCEQVRSTSKSRYFPVEMSSVLNQIRQQPGRYAVVGVPCFVKAVRLLQQTDAVFAERILFCVGLVCGHLKSSKYADSLAWQLGVRPGELKGIDFRTKIAGEPADQYAVTVMDDNGSRVWPVRELLGADWGAGAFKYKACDFCDDVFAETADIVLGDAWLPEFVDDSAGTNIILIRNPQLEAVVTRARHEGRVVMLDLSPADAARSQAGGLRHRRDALGYRLIAERSKGAWTPRKRVRPGRYEFAKYERDRQDARTALRDMSHVAHRDAVKTGNFALYEQPVRRQYAAYKAVGGGLIGRLFAAIRRRIRRIP